ncbi:MAG: serine O-acetyltransferase EpsC [Brevinematales bacterium]|jgi:serine O-acetyltransferase
MDDFQNKIKHLVSDITASYKNLKSIIPQDLGPLPDRDEIIAITKLLRKLLFPGYFGKQNFDHEIISFHTGDLLIHIREKLREQIIFAFRHRPAGKSGPGADTPEDMADGICLALFGKIPGIRNFLATDVQAAFEGDPAASSTDEIIFSYPGIFAISVYRLAHELYLLSVPLIPRIMSEYAHNITGIDIHPGAKIGEYFFIDHGTGVVIGETTEIGNNVKIYQGVTLGALSTRGGQNLRGSKRHPTIEDEVTIYSGASIFGGETVIGRAAVIGSNTFITRSIPGDTKVSIRNPELLFKDSKPRAKRAGQDFDWSI